MYFIFLRKMCLELALVRLFVTLLVCADCLGHFDDFPLQEGPIFGSTLECSEMDECESRNGGGWAFDTKICATNGRTFGSLCEFMRAHCQGGGAVNFKNYGECSVSEKCFGERQAALREAKSKKGVFIPGCNADGTFKSVQCHKDTGYCWCSSPLGHAVRGTVTQNAVPNCTNLTRKSPTESGSTERPPIWYRGGCEGQRRKSFNKNIIKSMVKEFRRENDLIDFSRESLVEGLEKATLKWKFEELNTRKDNWLRKSEYKGIQKIIRRNFKPRKCAKKFPKICDLDSDKNISLEEWIACFTSDQSPPPLNKKDKTRNKKGMNTGKKKLGKGKVRKPYPCEYDKKQALESGNANAYVPKCDNRGKFRPVQCYGSNATDSWYCFCVDVESGNMIENTSVRYSTPNCSVSWPKCPPPKKEEIFLKALKKHFIEFVKQKILKKHEAANAIIDEVRAIEEVFRYCDRDKNDFLEKKEKRRLKNVIDKKNRRIWRCGRKIHKVCDSNADNKISLQELHTCVNPDRGSKRNNESYPNRPTHKKMNGKPHPFNPFIEIIKSE